MSSFLILFIFLGTLIFGLLKKVNCYDCFIEGAIEGSKITVNMFSYLLIFTIAISFLNASGLIEFISNILLIIIKREYSETPRKTKAKPSILFLFSLTWLIKA